MKTTLEKTLDVVAHAVVYGGILLFLWIMVGGMFGAAWAVAARVYEWLT